LSLFFRLTIVSLCLVWSVNANIIINSPSDGATVTSPVELNASISPNPRYVFVYDNNNLILQQQHVSTVTASLNLAPGSHTITVTAKYRHGWSYSATSNITVSTQTSGGGGGGTGGGGSSNVAAQIAGDMTGSNEGHPHGVPSSYDFYSGPSIGEGNNIAPNSAIEWWGVLYVGPNGNSATNTLVNVRASALYWLSASTGKWTSVPMSASQVDSDFFSEDFSVDYGTTVPMRIESDGSYSFATTSGKVAHFYAPYPRIPVDNADLAGVVAICEARLVLNNPSGPDDRASASFLLATGADPYPATTGAGIENNPNIGFGKFKYVQTAWRSFAMTTMTEAQLANNPPPVDLKGILP
jgi:hypothetical protein